VLRKGPRS